MPKKLLLVSFIIFLTALPTITSAQTQCKECVDHGSFYTCEPYAQSHSKCMIVDGTCYFYAICSGSLSSPDELSCGFGLQQAQATAPSSSGQRKQSAAPVAKAYKDVGTRLNLDYLIALP